MDIDIPADRLRHVEVSYRFVILSIRDTSLGRGQVISPAVLTRKQ
jgi:hypothetical protein